MNTRRPFHPLPPDAANILTWIHLGDLHMLNSGDQNHLDLAAIVEELNQSFAQSTSFVFLPGDVADDGSQRAYAVVRNELDRLQIPWCAILGDHDVHEKSFANFLHAMSPQTHYAFTIGSVRFLALNAFDIPHPGSFTITPDQLAWITQQLQSATDAAQSKILLIHCYPTDLKSGGPELSQLLKRFQVRLVDMGHTHYNELANDGYTLYSATRSTGQIEEGPVGFSITNLDGDAISWRFVELGQLPVAIITSPTDARLITQSTPTPTSPLKIRAKLWGTAPFKSVTARLQNQTHPMTQIPNSQVWETSIDLQQLPHAIYPLTIEAEDTSGARAMDAIQLAIGDHPTATRSLRDQDNFLAAWPEHGLLATQLGPNKNGKKW